ncbi:MAG: hypothetical protein VYB46_03010 [Pseudomonadota bacterium]|nr:hypothetical protein [Pseudomonadota bacterium]
MRYAIILALLLTACTEGADYPRLLPTEQLLSPPDVPDHAVAASPAAVEEDALSRAEALRARAKALQGPVVDPSLRRRAGL